MNLQSSRFMRFAFIAAALLLAGILFWFLQEKKLLQEDRAIPTSADYLNGAFEVDGMLVFLKNGRAEENIEPGSSIKRVIRYFGNRTSGDLDGDGTADDAFLLTKDGGGSGTYYYVVAAIRSKDGWRGTNAVLLGDRIAPQTTEIRNGEIIVNYAVRADNEPMSTPPSIGVSLFLRVENGRLLEPPKESNTGKGDDDVIACAQDVRKCPDNSFVGRIPPSCEFSPCPIVFETQKNGIKGLVLVGPTCPVMRDPPEEQCADKPLKTRLAVVIRDTVEKILEFESDSNGAFQVELPPGAYTIRSADAKFTLPFCNSYDIRVGAGLFTETIVRCDSGIR